MLKYGEKRCNSGSIDIHIKCPNSTIKAKNKRKKEKKDNGLKMQSNTKDPKKAILNGFLKSLKMMDLNLELSQINSII